MGEAKQEETKAEAKPAEEKKEEAKPFIPPSIILSMDLHCVGCAKKIERCILKCRGVEEVETDIEQNKVTVKGIADPEALCSRIQKKTLRSVKVISPLPPADDTPDSTNSQVVPASQVSGVKTVELQVRMHCDACAQQLRRKILKMRGVQAAEAELSTGKVLATGTMTVENLVDYIYNRTGKLAIVVPSPPPPPPPPPKEEEEKKEEGEKKEEENPPEEKKEEEKAEELPDDGKKEEEPKEDAKKEDGAESRMEGPENVIGLVSPEEMMMKRTMYWNGEHMHGEEENFGRRVMSWMPVYVIEQPMPPPPPPQMFSDENPNACCIS